MNKFDNVVNAFLENLIFEQDQNEIDSSNIIKKTTIEIETRNDRDRDAYIDESESKYNSDGERVADDILNFIKGLPKEQLSEQTGLEAAWSGLKDFGSAAWDKAKEYIGPSLHDIGDLAADKIGEYATDFIGKKYIDEINNSLSETVWYKIAAVLEPTGVMSWPYYRKALDLYEQHKGTEKEDIYFLNLLAAQISVIPGVRVPLGILTAPFKLLFLPLSIPVKIASFIRQKITEYKNAQKALSKLPILQRFFKTTTSVLKPIVKALPPIAKGTTVVSSGDIPKTIENLTKPTENKKPTAPKVSTLGKFPSFSSLSTQSF